MQRESDALLPSLPVRTSPKRDATIPTTPIYVSPLKRRKIDTPVSPKTLAPVLPIKRERGSSPPIAFLLPSPEQVVIRPRARAEAFNSVKRELSQSPPPEQPPRPILITSGSRRFAPIPTECQKKHPGYAESRKQWAEREKETLRQLGLTIVRMFVRDDGLVVDWTSSRPVWSDTLLPPENEPTIADTIRQAYNANAIPPPRRKKTTSPPVLREIREIIVVDDLSPPSSGQNGISFPDRQHADAAITSDRHASSGPSKLSTPWRNDIEARQMHGNSAPPLADDAVTDSDTHALEEEALEYLRKYLQTFDTDRSELASAYARDVVFSYRIHEVVSSSTVEAFAPRKESRDLLRTRGTLFQGRLDVITALLSLGPHTICASASAEVDFDMLSMGGSSVLLVCHGILVDPESGRRLHFDQSFMLRRKEVDEEDRYTEGLWPLVASSHQLTVRDLTAIS